MVRNIKTKAKIKSPKKKPDLVDKGCFNMVISNFKHKLTNRIKIEENIVISDDFVVDVKENIKNLDKSNAIEVNKLLSCVSILDKR